MVRVCAPSAVPPMPDRVVMAVPAVVAEMSKVPLLITPPDWLMEPRPDRFSAAPGLIPVWPLKPLTPDRVVTPVPPDPLLNVTAPAPLIWPAKEPPLIVVVAPAALVSTPPVVAVPPCRLRIVVLKPLRSSVPPSSI